MAKEKKQFTADSGLGFMRLIQILNVALILIILFMMFFMNGSTVKVLDLVTLSLIVVVVALALSVWIIAKRLVYGRKALIILLIVVCTVDQVTNVLMGVFSLQSCLGSVGFHGLLILYFATSRRAKAVFVRPLADHTLAQQQEAKNATLWDLKSLDFWLRLLIYFFAFSILGHWMEMGVQILVTHGLFPGTVAAPDSLTWRDHWNPFFIYGIAVVVCGLVLYPIFMLFKKKMSKKWQAYLLSFVVNAVFCTAAELILGFLFNADYQAWDYRNMFLNFQGQICLLYTLAFAVMSSVITWVIYPLMERQFSYVNRDVFRTIFVVCLVLYLFIYFTFSLSDSDMSLNFSSLTHKASS